MTWPKYATVFWEKEHLENLTNKVFAIKDRLFLNVSSALLRFAENEKIKKMITKFCRNS